jgi:uncharacterized membrane protein YbaN (DUF454 family)
MRYLKAGINYTLVLIFVFLGFVGLALPLVPQAIFFAIALIILSFEYPPLEKWVDKNLPHDNPVGKFYFSAKKQIEKFLGL